MPFLESVHNNFPDLLPFQPNPENLFGFFKRVHVLLTREHREESKKVAGDVNKTVFRIFIHLFEQYLQVI